MFVRLYYFLLLTAAAICASGQEVVPLGEEDLVPLSPGLEILRDEKGELTLYEARVAEGYEFSGQGLPYLGYDSAVFWLRVRVASLALEQRQWVLELGSSRFDEVDWYLSKNGEMEHLVMGNLRDGGTGVMGSRYPTVLLALEPGEEAEILLRVKSPAIIRLPLRAYDAVSYRSQTDRQAMVYLMVFGASGILCLLGVIFGVWGMWRSALVYALSAASTAILYAGIEGFGKMSGLPGAAFWSTRGIHFFTETGLLTMVWYLSSFFDLKTRWPRAARIARLLVVGCAVLMVVSVLSPYFYMVGIVRIQSSLFSIFCFVVGVVLWRRGVKFARFYLLSWFSLWFFLTIDFLCDRMIIPVASSQDYLSMVGLLGGYIFLFIAMADRARGERQVAEKAQARLLNMEREMTASLEEKVNQRTRSLQEAVESAERANRYKETFLINMSHEIRTPLSALLGLSQVMCRQSEQQNLPENFTRMLRQVRSGGGHLNLMLTNMMDIGANNQGMQPVRWQEVKLGEWSQSVHDIMEPLAQEKGLTLSWRESGLASETFRSDPMRLTQILINLVHNALKFSPSEGTVEVDLVREGESFQMRVRDHGVGLPSEPQRLFEAFRQNDEIVSDGEQGVGLGLHIVQNNVRLLNGAVTAENHPEGGAFFCVKFILGESEWLSEGANRRRQ